MTEPVLKRRAPSLDTRLSAAMMLAENSRVFADIGADHGRLSTVMLLGDAHRRALVSDISAAALGKARALIRRMGLDDRVTFAVADGLDALDAASETVDTVFVLGMGGETIGNMLHRGGKKLNGATLILGAQTELLLVRMAIVEIGYRIRREMVVRDGVRDYVLLTAKPMQTGEAEYTDEEILLGPVFLKELPPNWLPLLERQERLLHQGIAAMQAAGLSKDSRRLLRFETEMGYVQHALQLLREEETP